MILMKKILVVEDDLYIGNLIEELLKMNNYQVIRAYSGTEAVLQFASSKPDLVLLDLMLPGLSGEEVIGRIKGNVPIIVLSAKSGKSDRINNLLNGCNDYITKPFDNDELLARIQVQIRSNALVNTDVIAINELTINKNTHEAFVAGNLLKLTRSEFAILSLLMSKPNHVFSRSAIVESIWDCEAVGDEETVKVHISNLRNKIREFSETKYIETVWGIGFKINIES
jgi:DNA-binding response OmpR family regulator